MVHLCYSVYVSKQEKIVGQLVGVLNQLSLKES